MKPFTDGDRPRARVSPGQLSELMARLSARTRHHSAPCLPAWSHLDKREWQILFSQWGLMSHVTYVEDSGHPAIDPQSCSHFQCSCMEISSSKHIPQALLAQLSVAELPHSWHVGRGITSWYLHLPVP